MVTKLKLCELIHSRFACDPYKANPVFEAIYTAMSQGEDVELYFKGCSRVIGTFLNSAIGTLYGWIQKEEIEKHLSFPDADEDMLKKLKLVKNTAIKFYADHPQYLRKNLPRPQVFNSVGLISPIDSDSSVLLKHESIELAELESLAKENVVSGTVLSAIEEAERYDEDSFRFIGVRIYCRPCDYEKVLSNSRYKGCSIYEVNNSSPHIVLRFTPPEKDNFVEAEIS